MKLLRAKIDYSERQAKDAVKTGELWAAKEYQAVIAKDKERIASLETILQTEGKQ